ncbi:MAG: DUF4270 domain-containing protein [Tannerella sp.]|jgi:hypothetical protein|nr:DUF4270 domain-containing protein [Tannerella sp.]
MNLKQYITLIVLCTGGFALSNCSADSNLVGSGIQPDEDFITVYTDTFQIASSTVKKDSLYAKTTEGMLGEFYDPLYGHLKSDYLCQFYCKEGFRFWKTPYEGKIDSLSLYIYYTYTGNPQAVMQIQAYPVTKLLNKDYCTNIHPEDYCDMQNPLGFVVHSPANGTEYDTTLNVYRLEIKFPVELGQKIYEETIHNPSTFTNQTAFNQFFPGIYVTTTYGNGSMLNLYQDEETKLISHTELKITYNYALKDTEGKDSLITASEYLSATKEVIQLNRVVSYGEEQLLAPNDDYSYLKTPAGIFTRLVIPAKEIGTVVKSRILNNLTLKLKYMPQEDWIYSLAPPPWLLLLPEDSLSSYFKTNNIDNNITTFLSYPGGGYSSATTLSGYNASERTYYFGNIVNLLNYHLAKNPDEDLKVLVVPVKRNYNEYTTNYSSINYMTTSFNHYFAPSGVKLRKDTESMKIVLTSSKY